MDAMTWFYYYLITGTEYFLLNTGFLQLPKREFHPAVKLFLMLLPLVSYFLIFTPVMPFEFCLMINIYFHIIIFKNSVLSFIKNVSLTFLSISIWDSLFWSIGAIFSKDAYFFTRSEFRFSTGAIGFIIFISLYFILMKKRLLPIFIWKNLSDFQSFLLLLGIFAMYLLFSFMQGFLVGQMTKKLEKFAVLFCLLTIIFMFIVFVTLIYTIQKKNYLEVLTRMEEKYLRAQQQYFQKTTEQYEELRKFRHDIKHHFFVLDHLTKEGKREELEKYLDQLQKSEFPKTISYTGHTIVDALFCEIFKTPLAGQSIQFSFHGIFPIEFHMENPDICILFANAFQNALEALEQEPDTAKRHFTMEIFSNEQEVICKIQNTLHKSHPLLTAYPKSSRSGTKKQTDFLLQTTKDNKKNHGFGTKAMAKVVKKYKGEIKWAITDENQMEVSIFLPTFPAESLESPIKCDS